VKKLYRLCPTTPDPYLTNLVPQILCREKENRSKAIHCSWPNVLARSLEVKKRWAMYSISIRNQIYLLAFQPQVEAKPNLSTHSSTTNTLPRLKKSDTMSSIAML